MCDTIRVDARDLTCFIDALFGSAKQGVLASF
eukprot:COSAG01_NODE_6986_length_3403_cov_3.437651_4_plen_32_part_00